MTPNTANGARRTAKTLRVRLPADVPAPPPSAYRTFKSFAERAAAALALVALTPVVVLAALAVRATSPGPAFYSQVRLGRRGRKFKIVKLRTMRYGCEAATGPVWSTPNDPRVTPLGRVFRRLHIDELPQLWNIAVGDMSFVGPRPERPEIADKLVEDIPNFHERLALTPGLTGLAQVLQMADTSVESARTKLQYDLEYIDREGPWLDFRIVLGTAAIIFGVSRARTAQWLALRAEPAGQHAAAHASESIFDHSPKLKTAFDSGVLGAR